ncbi:hypothetical protein [Paenibacillus psychroresistens]|uniref:hypothetical protein n=1 Tax=Paenibacillus psychroresistens TaxID=1778678 RepID=UPI001878F7C0|nr:hypothetical protein [Paenibacillus psychroresistens]
MNERQSHRGAPFGNKNAIGNQGGAPPMNQNALGNRGGHGAAIGNKHAITTGEHETIWLDTLQADEVNLYPQIKTDIRLQFDEEIRLLTIRERRMLQRIQSLCNGMNEKQRRVLQERRTIKTLQQYEDKNGKTQFMVMPEEQLVITQIEEKEYRVTDDILKYEEALTRIQGKKIKVMLLKKKLEDSSHLLPLILEEKQQRINMMRARTERWNS